MHRFLTLDEMVRLLARELVESKAGASAVSLACCCKNFEDPVLDVLWETQDRLIPLLKCLSQEVWKGEGRELVSSITTSPPSVILTSRLLKVLPKNPNGNGMD